MKNNLAFSLLRLSIVFILLSCNKKDDDDNKNGPEYAGNWVFEYFSEVYDTDMKETLTLTENTYQSITSMSLSNNWIDTEGIKGTTTMSGDTTQITFTQVGRKGDSNEMVWYEPETNEFKLRIATDYYGYETVKLVIMISGNQLTMIMDKDHDGEYSSDETAIYTKI